MDRPWLAKGIPKSSIGHPTSLAPEGKSIHLYFRVKGKGKTYVIKAF